MHALNLTNFMGPIEEFKQCFNDVREKSTIKAAYGAFWLIVICGFLALGIYSSLS